MTAEDKILISFLEEKADQCRERMMITESRFLDMHEKSISATMKLPYGVRRIFYGGFESAERNVAIYLPEYVSADDYNSLSEFFKDSPDDCPIVILGIKKDKFSKALSHRDYLGALMGLGINRDMTGDIVVTETGAYIAVIKSMAEYISENMVSAGRGTLTTEIKYPWEIENLKRNEGVSDSFTVSSPRLDSMVKNAFSVSRDDACEAITHGLVFVNDIECMKPDKRIVEGDKITLRHKGRIIIESMPGKSKRGRDIINIKQFIY